MLTGYCGLVGDMLFQATRRFWTQTTHAPNYAYLFTDVQLVPNPAIGAFHGVEILYLFVNTNTTGRPNVANLRRKMLDYWISFAVSLTPNDGKGSSSALRCASISVLLPLILHLGPHWETYKKNKVWLNAFMFGKCSTWYRRCWSLTATVRG